MKKYIPCCFNSRPKSVRLSRTSELPSPSIQDSIIDVSFVSSEDTNKPSQSTFTDLTFNGFNDYDLQNKSTADDLNEVAFQDVCECNQKSKGFCTACPGRRFCLDCFEKAHPVSHRLHHFQAYKISTRRESLLTQRSLTCSKLVSKLSKNF
jgi:hypothetical protein